MKQWRPCKPLIVQTSFGRSTLSARAPAGSVNRKKGRDATVDINDSNKGDPVIFIIQIAALSWATTQVPEITAAIHGLDGAAESGWRYGPVRSVCQTLAESLKSVGRSAVARTSRVTAAGRAFIAGDRPCGSVQTGSYCNKLLRQAVHLWANLSRQSCPWAAVYYEQLRTRGKNHACALRSLGQRWLKILWKMWQTGTRYDAELHARNQLKHGSWILKIQHA